MNKLKQYFSLAIVFWSGVNLSQSSLAQVPNWAPNPYLPPPAIDYLKPEQIRPDLYGPNGSDPAPQFRSPNNSLSTPSGSFASNIAIIESANTALSEHIVLLRMAISMPNDPLAQKVKNVQQEFAERIQPLAQ